MSKRVHHMDAVAIRKSGIEGWEPFKWEAVGDDAILTGAVPRLLKRGPRKGRKTWEGKGTSVVVTRVEVEAEAARYVAETGNCAKCYGEGQVFASWNHIDGTKHKACHDCKGSGRATKEAA
jgi:hypothetical protein